MMIEQLIRDIARIEGLRIDDDQWSAGYVWNTVTNQYERWNPLDPVTNDALQEKYAVGTTPLDNGTWRADCFHGCEFGDSFWELHEDRKTAVLLAIREANQ